MGGADRAVADRAQDVEGRRVDLPRPQRELRGDEREDERRTAEDRPMRDVVLAQEGQVAGGGAVDLSERVQLLFGGRQSVVRQLAQQRFELVLLVRHAAEQRAQAGGVEQRLGEPARQRRLLRRPEDRRRGVPFPIEELEQRRRHVRLRRPQVAGQSGGAVGDARVLGVDVGKRLDEIGVELIPLFDLGYLVEAQRVGHLLDHGDVEADVLLPGDERARRREEGVGDPRQVRAARRQQVEGDTEGRHQERPGEPQPWRDRVTYATAAPTKTIAAPTVLNSF